MNLQLRNMNRQRHQMNQQRQFVIQLMPKYSQNRQKQFWQMKSVYSKTILKQVRHCWNQIKSQIAKFSLWKQNMRKMKKNKHKNLTTVNRQIHQMNRQRHHMNRQRQFVIPLIPKNPQNRQEQFWQMKSIYSKTI